MRSLTNSLDTTQEQDRKVGKGIQEVDKTPLVLKKLSSKKDLQMLGAWWGLRAQASMVPFLPAARRCGLLGVKRVPSARPYCCSCGRRQAALHGTKRAGFATTDVAQQVPARTASFDVTSAEAMEHLGSVLGSCAEAGDVVFLRGYVMTANSACSL